MRCLDISLPLIFLFVESKNTCIFVTCTAKAIDQQRKRKENITIPNLNIITCKFRYPKGNNATLFQVSSWNNFMAIDHVLHGFKSRSLFTELGAAIELQIVPITEIAWVQELRSW